MKLFIEKDKCKITESLNERFLEIETDEEIEFVGQDGNRYLLYDECEEGIGPAPCEPFVVKLPKMEKEEENNNG